MRSPRWHWSWWTLVIGLVASAGALLTPDEVTSAWSYLAVALLGVALSVAGAHRVPDAMRPVWGLLAVGQLLYLGGDVVWTVMEVYQGIYPASSMADVLYLAHYLCVVAALVALVRGRRRTHDRAALLDAAIISTGFGVLFAVFFVLPSARTGGPSTMDQVVAAAYPCADFAVLAVFVTLLTSGSLRSASSWALAGGLLTMLVVDVPFLVSVNAGLHYPQVLDLGYLVTYVLLGFAAVHPAAATLGNPGPAYVETVGRTRVVLLGLAMMLAPLTDEVAHLTGLQQSSHVVLAGALLGTTLVLLRLWDLLRSLERKAAELAALARVDGLTGVPNRRTWDHELARACTAARTAHQPLVVAVLDLDHFKAYNDAHGHLMGDLVLKEAAAAWREILDGTGLVARFGGEEFTVLLPDHRLDAAEPVLERLRSAVPAGQTCSIGVAVWDFSEEPDQVVARADRALYHAKRSGRDRIAVHDGVAAREVRPPRSAGVESLLSTVFQPIVCLATGEPAAFEALSRFTNGNPQDVFDSAVLHGTQASLEAAAVRSALDAWDGTLPVSLNLSGATLCSREVQAALEGDLSAVIIELTESDSAATGATALATVEDLRARGARIAVDDFGVGFSNVERVARLNPDLLKLDMSLVRGIDRNPMLQAVVRGCLTYVQETGALVCAEGIETAAELATLRGLGVQLGQGYLLGRPHPYEHYEGCTDLASEADRDLFREAAGLSSSAG